MFGTALAKLPHSLVIDALCCANNVWTDETSAALVLLERVFSLHEVLTRHGCMYSFMVTLVHHLIDKH